MLETSRLRMRGHQLSDFENSARLWGDPAVTQYIREKPFTPEESWSRLLRHAGHWALLGFGMWVVEDKSSGAFVGDVGFLDLRRDLDPPVDLAPEVGWVLTPSAHGQGYATEAVQAALAWGDEKFDRARTTCIIAPQNQRSIRVAEKCGFRESMKVKYHGTELLLLARDLGKG
ncbi:GNAT family N-acetyltransferase [Candidatus Korobacter versatilis]|uniref:GNAT family N-acetyltransferase n=1 Tax=Candidatus Korobacter versatilis TaxID=658062 RepID=UPI001E40B4D7|nr:GNAT family N-acetyltransferase [Candidatus Koribacter versatilis]